MTLLFEDTLPVPGGEPSPQRTFRIGSLMLLIGVVAVCLGLFREMPGPAVLIMLVTLPALARTIGRVSSRNRQGRPPSWNDRILIFVVSLAIVCVLLIATVVSFVAICLPTTLVLSGGGGTLALVTGVVAGLVAAVVAAYFVILKLWNLRDP